MDFTTSAWAALQLVPRESSISPVFLTKSRSATGLAEDFQERQGANVKTNDSSCKERGGEEGRGISVGEVKGEGGKENIHGRRGYKGGCTHPDDDNSLLFPSQPRLARSGFRLLFLPSFLPSLQSPESPLPPSVFFLPPRGFTTKYRSPPRTEVYLNVFRDQAIHPYCSAFSIGFQFFEGCAREPRRYLFTVMGAVASIRLVKVHRAARKSFTAFFPVLLKFVALQRTCLDWIKFNLLPRTLPRILNSVSQCKLDRKCGVNN